jgi:hypothetical protein
MNSKVNSSEGRSQPGGFVGRLILTVKKRFAKIIKLRMSISCVIKLSFRGEPFIMMQCSDALS